MALQPWRDLAEVVRWSGRHGAGTVSTSSAAAERLDLEPAAQQREAFADAEQPPSDLLGLRPLDEPGSKPTP
jgi:hypothetical protein